MWTIIIEGSGLHHTAAQSGDANLDAASLVETLRAHGHGISSAVFRTGSEHQYSDEDITDPEAYRAKIGPAVLPDPVAPTEPAPVAVTSRRSARPAGGAGE